MRLIDADKYLRLIDADKFLAQIEGQYMEHDITRAQYADLEGRILEQPIVDSVEVVRCRDCKYWDTSPASTAAPAYHECKARASRLGRVHTTAEEFCSRGERKDGEHETD